MKESVNISVERYDELKRKETHLGNILKRNFISQGVWHNGMAWFHYHGHRKMLEQQTKILNENENLKMKNYTLEKIAAAPSEALRPWWKLW